MVNTLFVDDSTMHKIYEDKGSFKLLYQLPQIAYSSIISSIFSYFLEILALSEGIILDFKKRRNVYNLDNITKILDKRIKIKFLFYFLISTIFLLFF